jgi:hypothetical protein
MDRPMTGNELEAAKQREAWLRKELAEERANSARWCARIKELEERLEKISRISTGGLP